MKELKIKGVGSKDIVTYIFDEVANPKGIIQIVHGAAERASRYFGFAKLANERGYIVVTNDHRGHGKTANLEENELGFFAENDGWNIIVDDLFEITKYIKSIYDLPISMMGHSMGSFMARSYAIKYGDHLESIILSGTGDTSRLLIKFLKSLATKHQKKYSAKHIDQKIWNLSFKGFNKKFNNETSNGTEWQTSDLDVQKAFLDDPLCGFVFTSSAFKDLAEGLLFITNYKKTVHTNKDLVTLVISGGEDPVGGYGKEPKRFVNKLRHIGCKDVTLKIYPGLRHEILFEQNREQVESDVFRFLELTLIKK